MLNKKFLNSLGTLHILNVQYILTENINNFTQRKKWAIQITGLLQIGHF